MDNCGQLGGVGGIGGTAPVDGDSLIFAGAVRLDPINNFGANTNFAGITFSATVSTFTLTGNAINLTGDVINSSAAVQNINLGLNLTGNRTINAALGDITIGGVISGGFGITKTGPNTLTLNSAANAYTGGTTLGTGAPSTGGTITLGASGALGSGGFTFAGGVLNTANFNHTTSGALSLTADSTLNLGAGGALADLNFGSGSWTGGILTINNWTGTAGTSGTDDQIFIATNPDATFLSQITFFGFAPGATWLGTGEIVPVPEPINVALGVFGVVFAGFGFARRLRARRAVVES